MMTRRLPPLNALRAFEAAARHQSFTVAADELGVTQGAVSRQVKALEDHYRAPLFRREHRRVALTDQGRALLPAVSDALDRIAAASDRLLSRERDLTVKVPPTFAARWLIPRLHRFQDAHPGVQVRLTTAWPAVDFAREDFDAGIVCGERESDGGLRRDLVFTERATPVCAPGLLLEGAVPLRRPEDLARHRLLLNAPDDPWDWRLWAEAAGVREELPLDAGLAFDTDDAAIQAAVAGAGVALAALRFVEEDLRTGRLVAPLDLPPLEIGAYYLVCPKPQADSPRVAAFRAWLLDEAAGRPPAARPEDAPRRRPAPPPSRPAAGRAPAAPALRRGPGRARNGRSRRG